MKVAIAVLSCLFVASVGTYASHLPKQLKLDDKVFAIRVPEKWPFEAKYAGATCDAHAVFMDLCPPELVNTISIKKGQPFDDERLTVFHESTHFTLGTYHTLDVNTFSNFVHVFVPAFVAVLRQNPAFVKYLLKTNPGKFSRSREPRVKTVSTISNDPEADLSRVLLNITDRSTSFNVELQYHRYAYWIEKPILDYFDQHPEYLKQFISHR